EFSLDKAELVCPHCNAVFFGKERLDPSDEFPLLYANVYNNYSKDEDRRIGQLCVYRLWRDSNSFATELVQLIEIGFTDQFPLWNSFAKGEECRDVRPYGNFLADPEKDVLYAFTMRDKDRTTRYFSFPMPSCKKGEFDPALGVPHLVLNQEDILDQFDTPYHKYIQGGALHGGLIYSTEGFGEKESSRSAIRIIDPAKKCQIAFFDLCDAGLPIEPEWMDFYEGKCLYSSASGDVYEMDFEL
ncbi:MAG: hypothetical protein IJC26_05900, partial [Clostridia bacterium]|nr:hypothetical protein [Clostridia bacterium]